MVYDGQEGGFISIWELDMDDGYPQCVEVMKVSVSDVLSLEGVNDRLWAGSRNGIISAYVSRRLWLVMNSWMARPRLPVKGVNDKSNVFGTEYEEILTLKLMKRTST